MLLGWDASPNEQIYNETRFWGRLMPDWSNHLPSQQSKSVFHSIDVLVSHIHIPWSRRTVALLNFLPQHKNIASSKEYAKQLRN